MMLLKLVQLYEIKVCVSLKIFFPTKQMYLEMSILL